ncbi:hypothetical protein V1460_12415 [Streptomyces sp. SCSIO 30461]|uniref:hypothetical protein n=1 Tax=Streptomyces sp. SCSIO 30461 TaxID=3118085 RepID=UPI0030CD559A
MLAAALAQLTQQRAHAASAPPHPESTWSHRAIAAQVVVTNLAVPGRRAVEVEAAGAVQAFFGAAGG